MAHSSTVYSFTIGLSDVDRGVYCTLPLKVACHPSETMEYMVTRVLAYALELEEGLAFSQGLSVADEPALWVRDLTGALQAWIEVGSPDAARLHRATKASARVVVYNHKDIAHYLRNLAGAVVHAPERIRIVEMDRRFIADVAAKVERRSTIDVSVTEQHVYVDIGGASFNAPLHTHPFPA